MKMADQAWVMSADGTFNAGAPKLLLADKTIQQVFKLPDDWIAELNISNSL